MHQANGDLPVMMEGDGLSVRSVEFEGMRANMLEIPAGVDFTPALKGLPDDLCPAAHWGYVLEGSVNFRSKDGTEEKVSAGEVFCLSAGHTAWTTEAVKFFEVSPAAEMEQLLNHVKGASG